MVEVGTAGTFIAAVMETAGYITQESILETFIYPLRSLAILFYLLACIGAFVSVALLGNYRLGAGLVLGPILFGFLVFTRASTGGVVWRIGAGEPRAEDGSATTTTAAAGNVRSLAETKSVLAQQVSSRPRDSIGVAWPFLLYTKLVDGVVRSLQSLILPLKDDNNENVRNMLAVSRTHALESLISLKPDDTNLIGIISSDLLYKCREMMDGSSALGSYENRVSRIQELYQIATVTQQQTVQNIYDRTIQTINRNRSSASQKLSSGKQQSITAGSATRNFMIRDQERVGSGTRQWLDQRHGSGSKVENIGSLNMTCGELWNIAADAIWQNAEKLTSGIFQNFGGQLGEQEKGALCVELARKVGIPLADTDAQSCRTHAIVSVASTLILRNAIQELGYSKAARRARDDMQLIASDRRGTMTAQVPDVENWIPVDPYSMGIREYSNDPIAGPKHTTLFKHKDTGEIKRHSYTTLETDIHGQVDAAFVVHQRWMSRDLRQQIFTYAIQFPYYQGLILFLLAAAYPFMALVVVVPGKAGTFVNYMLTWLWVKSWDVGFACVMVLDKILWNLFPSSDFSEDFYGGKKLGEQAIPEVLYEAMKIDPAYNVHAYYFILSTALFSIPAITGLATVKLRRSMAESAAEPLFDQQISNQTEDAGQKARGVFGITSMNYSQQLLKELYGSAGLTVSQNGEGLLNGTKALSAEHYAKMGAESSVLAGRLSHGDPQTSAQNLQQLGLLRDVQYQSVFNQMLSTETALSSQNQRVFNKLDGAFGSRSMKVDTMNAYLDGSGNYEVTKKSIAGLISSMVDATQTKIGIEAEWRSTFFLAGNDQDKFGNDNPLHQLLNSSYYGKEWGDLFLLGHTTAWRDALLQYRAEKEGRNPLRDYYNSLPDTPEDRERAEKWVKLHTDAMKGSYSDQQIEEIKGISLDPDARNFRHTDSTAFAPLNPFEGLNPRAQDNSK